MTEKKERTIFGKTDTEIAEMLDGLLISLARDFFGTTIKRSEITKLEDEMKKGFPEGEMKHEYGVQYHIDGHGWSELPKPGSGYKKYKYAENALTERLLERGGGVRIVEYDYIPGRDVRFNFAVVETVW